MGKFHQYIGVLVLFIICTLVILLSNVTLDIGPLPTNRVSKLHCPKNSRCYWTTEKTAGLLRLQINATTADLLAGLLASGLLVIGEMTGIYYCLIPWLFFCFKSMLTLQGPAIFRFGHEALSRERYSATAFMLITVFLYAEEWCLWFEMLNSYKILWKDRKSKLQLNASLEEFRRNHDSIDIANRTNPLQF